MSTAADLNRFVRALFRGRLFRRASTLATMLRGVASGPQFFYGLGVGETFVDHTWFVGHSGSWGTDAVMRTSDGATFVVALNQWDYGVDIEAYRTALAHALDAARGACGSSD